MEKTESLAMRLHLFHQKVGTLTKSRKAKAGAYSYSYFDINAIIDEVKPILNECGIVMMQPLDMIDGKLVMRTILINAYDSADRMEFTCPLAMLNKAQDMGSQTTYYRRYTAQSLLFLEAEDDDGKRANQSITTAQVNQIASLASDETIQTLLDKKGMNCLDDLNSDEANKLISYLRKVR